MSFFSNFVIFKQNRNYALLYFGRFISFFGTMMTGVALPYQIYTQTRSTLMVGLLSLIQLLPLLFTALIGGVFADRYPRRLLILLSEIILMLGSLALTINASTLQPSLVFLFIMAFIMSATSGLHNPALSSLVQQLVVNHDYHVVSRLSTFQNSICMIGGPALGGMLIAHFGLTTALFTDFISFVISLICILFLKNVPKLSNKNNESTWTLLMEGIRYATSKQELLGSYLVDFIAMIFGMPTALFPAIAASFGTAKVLGLLYAAPAIGSLILSVFSGWTANVRRYGVAIALAAIGWGIAIILFGLIKNFWIAWGFLCLAGAMDAISGMFRGILWNQCIPQKMRGRLVGIEMISYLSGPRLGDTEAGLVAASFGISASVISGGVLCVIGVAVCCYYMPGFWNYSKDQSLN